jgi:hypothetical protein
MKKPDSMTKVIEFLYSLAKFQFHFLFRTAIALSLVYSPVLNELSAQSSPDHQSVEDDLSMEEISVLVILEGYPNFYVDALYANNNSLYIDIKSLFSVLKIQCITGDKESLKGYIEKESRTYLIDYPANKIIVGSKNYNANNGLASRMGSVYVETSLLAEAFGIYLTFNFRSLSVVLKSSFELPVIKLLRLSNIRNNISKIQGEMNADTVIPRTYHLFKPGIIDWSLASFQSLNGATNNRISLGIGTELLYGEADFSINYYDKYEFDNRQLFYLWKWVNNDRSLIKQAQIGRISNQTISFLNAPVTGAVLRNSPTTLRKAGGYYTITDVTEPDWTVELYINNVLVDFAKADASGLYTFKVPIVYGYTALLLKFYGPMGEERSEERSLHMPYTIMPAGEFEYSISGGIVQDSSSSLFGRAEFNYGLNRFMTLGGGLEFLSSIPNQPYIPFANLTIQPHSKFTLNAEYAHGVRYRALIDYYFLKNALIVLDYTKYVEGQMATRFNALEERKFKLSLPFNIKKLIGYSKVDFSQYVYNTFNFYQASLLLSAYYKQFNANSSTQINWIDKREAFITSDIAFSFRLRKGFLIRPATQFNVSENRFVNLKLSVEKTIPKGYFSLTYERYLISDNNHLSINFKYDLSFARTNLNASYSQGNLSFSESAHGSLAFGSGNNYIYKSNNTSMSKGGIALYPFLDLNQNGKFDKGEKMVKLSSVKVMGGKTFFNKNDSIVRITDLNAFTYHIIEFDNTNLESISLRFTNNIYKVLIDPNQFKRVDIPVIAVGEVSGMTFLNKDNSLKGIGRILVKFYRKESSKLVAETLSEYDGYIYYLGLAPGEYIAKIDSLQLSNLAFRADPPQIEFKINAASDGDIVGNLDFVLNSDEKYTMALNTNPKILSESDENKQISIDKNLTFYNPEDTLYRVQLLALSKPIQYQNYFDKLMTSVKGLVVIETYGIDSLYHYSAQNIFKDIKEARQLQRTIKNTGWKDSFVAVYSGNKLASLNTDLKTIYPATDGTEVLSNDIVYRVQLLALRIPLREKSYFDTLKNKVSGLIIEETYEDDGLYHYGTKIFEDREMAQKTLRIIKESGWYSCIITNYKKENLLKQVHKTKNFE